MNQLKTPDEMYDDVAGFATKVKKKGSLYVVQSDTGTSTFKKGHALLMGALIGGIAISPAYAADDGGGQEKSKLSLGGDLRIIDRQFYNTPFDMNINTGEARIRSVMGYDFMDNLSLGARAVAEFSTLPAVEKWLQDQSEFYVDRAFMKYNNGNLELMLGAFGNEFNHWKDFDIPLVGGQAKYTVKDFLGMDKLGAKVARHIGTPSNLLPKEANTGLWAVELDAEKGFGDNLTLYLNANYMKWGDPDRDFVQTNSPEAQFDIVHAGGRLAYGPLALFGMYSHNFAEEENNNGFIVGVQLGDIKEAGDASVILQHRHIGQDAEYAPYTMRGTPKTNFDQPVVIGQYQLNDLVKLHGVAAFPKRIGGDQRWVYLEAGININLGK